MFEYQTSTSIKLQSQNVAYENLRPSTEHRDSSNRPPPRVPSRMSQAVTNAASQRQALDDNN